MEKKQRKFQYKDEVMTPEGVGEIQEESTFGEFRIHIEKKGFRWYFPEDLELIREGETVPIGPQEEDEL